jgi:prenyltransferase beta subunit
MSLQREMLQAAALAPHVLGKAAEAVRVFLASQQTPEGGFKDRAGQTDLYYTVFGLAGLAALQAPWHKESLLGYLRTFGDGASLDLVHLACLGRCWALSGHALPLAARQALAARAEQYRTPDGGYHVTAGQLTGSAYGCFLALGLYQELDLPQPRPKQMTDCLWTLEVGDGSWANLPVSKAADQAGPTSAGSTLATAAALAVLRHLSPSPAFLPEVVRRPLVARMTRASSAWLSQRLHPKGGFTATPTAPIPDLLSTAVALHALAGMQFRLRELRESCLDYIDTLWTNQGGFHGHWADDVLDCEYTFYGLLALGHLGK